ncbi:MAG: cupin domain-containing protein [Deltaproteobacteria bacterium]|nr:cupin domain-containing protein [Deltaproteobacteria bacterium]
MSHHLPSLPLENISSLLLNVMDVLAEKPAPAGQDAYLLHLFHSPDITVSLAQIQGTLNSHYHGTHSETIYVLKGKGQALVEGQWVDLTPGLVMHFQGGQVHGARAEAGDKLVFLCLFVPGMKEIDRVFVD